MELLGGEGWVMDLSFGMGKNGARAIDVRKDRKWNGALGGEVDYLRG